MSVLPYELTSTCFTTVFQLKISTCINVCKIPTERFIKLLEFTKSSTGSSVLIRNSINSYKGFIFLPCHCKYLLGILWIPTSPTLIKWWFRNGDDVYTATRKDQVNNLQEHLNSIDLHFKFIIELPGTDGVPFLDTLTKPTPNSIESTVHRKPTNTDRYLDYNSNHPFSAKLFVIHILAHRAKQVCSTPEFLTKEIDHHHQVLQDNHYPAQLLQQAKPQQEQTHPWESL